MGSYGRQAGNQSDKNLLVWNFIKSVAGFVMHALVVLIDIRITLIILYYVLNG